ncbi:MAG TPA: ELWxxDGT repeat protein [Thermoanaerobaculia bacterium]|nr:ELWxxDGT repeat protein [Thermoanaerobaculia bacterium]
MPRVALIVLLSALAAVPAFAAVTPPPPFLVADLNSLPVESDAFPPADAWYSDPHGVELNGILYFAAADPAHGQELWRSDGTAAGTWRVSDVRPGPAGSNPRNLTVHQGRLYFTADDGVRGTEVWSTDGTSAGTLLLADLCPGPCSAAPFGYSYLASSGDRLFFTAARDGVTSTLWMTDGTRAGTVEVLANRQIFNLVPLAGGRVLFYASGNVGNELWSSDGTPQGTKRLAASGVYNLTSLGDRAVFWVSNDAWRTDGTVAETFQITRGEPYPVGPHLAWNGAVYYSNVRGQVWTTDGSEANTGIAGAGYSTTLDASPSQFTPSPCGLLFVAGDPTTGQLHIWRSLGSQGPVLSVTRLTDATWYMQVQLWNAGDQVFYTRVRETGSTELWRLDPTSCQSVEQVAELCGASRACASPYAYGGAAAGNTGLFVLKTAAEGAQLWRTDGTAAGTSLVRNLGIDPGSAGVTSLTALGPQVLFAARPGAGAAGLWRSDGTAAGTHVVKGRIPWPAGFIPAGGFLYFTAAAADSTGPCLDDGGGCQGLWRTDGTRPGTQLIKPDLFSVQGQGVQNGRLLFSASDSLSAFTGTGIEPWISDGTLAGTRQVADINQQVFYFPTGDLPPVPGSSSPGPPAWTGSAFLFAADDGLTGRELWASDGTAAGTRQVLDIHPRPQDPDAEGDSDPSSPVQAGTSPSFLFAADDGTYGRELWATDGTAPGTRRVRDLRPGADSSSPHDLVAFGGKVWFIADDGAGDALWSSDGTEAGTLQAAPLAFGGLPSRGRSLTVVGTRLFLVVDNDVLGTELWKSDGTAAGTRPVKDIRPGPGGSYPQSLTAVDGFLVFAADDGTSGLEPWVSDGTPRGTRRLGDLAAGPDASSPGPFAAAGPYVFFSAWDAVHGRELWAVPRSGLPGRTPLP